MSHEKFCQMVMRNMAREDTFYERLRDELDALKSDDEALSDPIEAFVAEYGYWGEHPKYSSFHWKSDIQCNQTRLGYWEWVESQIHAEGASND